jgi:MFS family permease
MPMFVAPFADVLAAKVGERPLLVTGLSFIAFAVLWFAHEASATSAYTSLLPSLIVGGIGSGLFWAPSASIVLSSVPEAEAGIASGTNNSIRELGGVFGVAVLTSIFSAQGSFATPERFVDGLTPAMVVGGVLVALAAVAAVALPRRRKTDAMEAVLVG